MAVSQRRVPRRQTHFAAKGRMSECSCKVTKENKRRVSGNVVWCKMHRCYVLDGRTDR